MAKYIFVSGERMFEIFGLLSSHGHKEEAKMVDKLLMFMAEYNCDRAFTQTHDIKTIKGEKKRILRQQPKYFWPVQNGSVNKFPWQSRLNGLKIRADHWIANKEALNKVLL